MGTDGQRAAADFEQMARVYADDADENPTNVWYERPAMLAMAGDVRGRRVLDVGSAAGGLAAELVARGAEVIGIDVSPSLIEIARHRLGARATFHVADLSEPLTFLADASIDVITASLVLHYVRDWAPPLREFRRVLAPDGVLLVSTHHPSQDVTLLDPPVPYFSTTLITDTWRKGGGDYRVRFYHRPLSAIVDALADAGFVIERIPEPVPDVRRFPNSARFAETLGRVPWFLFIRAVPDCRKR